MKSSNPTAADENQNHVKNREIAVCDILCKCTTLKNNNDINFLYVYFQKKVVKKESKRKTNNRSGKAVVVKKTKKVNDTKLLLIKFNSSSTFWVQFFIKWQYRSQSNFKILATWRMQVMLPESINQIQHQNMSICVFKFTSLQLRPGAYPIKILQRKFYAMLIFKHPDWLINLSSQSKCLKISIA